MAVNILDVAVNVDIVDEAEEGLTSDDEDEDEDGQDEEDSGSGNISTVALAVVLAVVGAVLLAGAVFVIKRKRAEPKLGAKPAQPVVITAPLKDDLVYGLQGAPFGQTPLQVVQSKV
eukprot:387819-Rhodomonas_salina.2